MVFDTAVQGGFQADILKTSQGDLSITFIGHGSLMFTFNCYVITFGNKRVYVAGDTENIPEMKKLERIDCAFLPMNLPYTMNTEMVADAAKAFKPKILYPYHYGDTDKSNIEQLMKDTQDVEIRIRMMK